MSPDATPSPNATPSPSASDRATDAPFDEVRQLVIDGLTEALGGAVLATEIRNDDLWVRIRADAWAETAEVCRDQLGFNSFCFISGIDWLPATWPNPKVVAGEAPEEAPAAEIVTGLTGGDTRFQVLARLYSIDRKVGVTLKADLDAEDPRIATWSKIYPGADWCERETWEMYGFVFEGHPNLIKLYLPGEFEGFPLRKDFPLLSREIKPWPGLVDVEQFPPGTVGEDD